MQVILKKDVDNLGNAHEEVKVRDGYGRNYLIPNGLAVVANPSNRKIAAEEFKQTARRREKLMAGLRELAQKLEGKSVKVGAKVGQSDKIFGSITNIQLADAIKKQLGVDLERKQITVPDDIRSLGSYIARIVLHREVGVDLTFEVVEE
jgi:large subunit ribosomal protein L9